MKISIKDTKKSIKDLKRKICDALEEYPDLSKKENSVVGQYIREKEKIDSASSYKELRNIIVNILNLPKIKDQPKAKTYLSEILYQYDPKYLNARPGSYQDMFGLQKLLQFVYDTILVGIDKSLRSPDRKNVSEEDSAEDIKHKHKLGDSVELDMSKFEDSVKDEKFAQDYVKELQEKFNNTMGEGSIWLTDWIKDSDTSSRILGYAIIKAEKPSRENRRKSEVETAKRDKELFEKYFKRSIPSDVKYKITGVQERWLEGFNPENRWIDFVLTIPVGQWSNAYPDRKDVNIDEMYLMQAVVPNVEEYVIVKNDVNANIFADRTNKNKFTGRTTNNIENAAIYNSDIDAESIRKRFGEEYIIEEKSVFTEDSIKDSKFVKALDAIKAFKDSKKECLDENYTVDSFIQDLKNLYAEDVEQTGDPEYDNDNFGSDSYNAYVDTIIDIAKIADKHFDNLTHTIVSKVEEMRGKYSYKQIIDKLIADAKKESFKDSKKVYVIRFDENGSRKYINKSKFSDEYPTDCIVSHLNEATKFESIDEAEAFLDDYAYEIFADAVYNGKHFGAVEEDDPTELKIVELKMLDDSKVKDSEKVYVIQFDRYGRKMYIKFSDDYLIDSDTSNLEEATKFESIEQAEQFLRNYAHELFVNPIYNGKHFSSNTDPRYATELKIVELKMLDDSKKVKDSIPTQKELVKKIKNKDYDVKNHKDLCVELFNVFDGEDNKMYINSQKQFDKLIKELEDDGFVNDDEEMGFTTEYDSSKDFVNYNIPEGGLQQFDSDEVKDLLTEEYIGEDNIKGLVSIILKHWNKYSPMFESKSTTKDSLSEEDHDRFVHELFGSMENVLRRYVKFGLSLGDIETACEFIINHLDGADIKLVEDSKVKDADNKGEQIAKIIAESLKGECGPFGGKNPYLRGNKLGLESQAPTEWFRFNNDGSVDYTNLKQILEENPEDFGYKDLTEKDKADILAEYSHFTSVEDLFNSDLSWFMYIDNKEEILKKVNKILKSNVNDSKVKDADDSEIEEIVHLLGEAHDKIIEAQDVVDSLVSDDELPDDVQWELDDLEAATSELDFMGEGNPIQAFKDHFGIDEDEDY